MNRLDLEPEIQYEKTEKGLILNSFRHTDGQIILPDEIDGIPIVEIAPYAFANRKELVGIRLSSGIREIGKYAFYRCNNLKKMILSDGILEIGGGALTGCIGIREVEIHFKNGERSALKSILDEVRFAVRARLYMRESIADILFPEHYEEAVEDTPARQLYTLHHGAGGDYRQCFYNRELDFKKYDALLPRARAEETVETVVKMALGRLKYPYKLSDDARLSYEKYVKEHAKEAYAMLIEADDLDMIRFLSEEKMTDEEAMNYAVECAGDMGKIEILSYLMNEKYQMFPKKKKRFEL